MIGALFQAVAAAAIGNAVQGAGRAARSLAAMLLAGLLIAIGLGFVTAAGYELIARTYGPLGAKLIFAALFLFIGLAVLVIAAWRRERARRLAASRGAVTAATAFMMGLTSGLGRRR
ncbi:hypothetical protein [Prosthecomicrobium pneumaticum]|uniref:Putative histidine transporter YuiF (NhaC family) n=1 Tax=Prosthecomicrobium pneumaticum TaxID=81895 RepID=A0A7W9FM96_9HYPH|nr:hypothetical protein [Prosthecomicrobium pneumaticum]MBB5753297.1 putative histidine transporter YuiF (NhaC family) [Prosthecomicrobium pneumaticum]